MQVKKYRATSAREALEQIKQDLGEDAFVLETKQVRVGGFMGVGSETQIEISAAAPDLAAKAVADKQRTRRNVSKNRLSLTDDSPAVPKSSESRQAGLMAALAARSGASNITDNFVNTFENEAPALPKILQNEMSAETRPIEAVEIANHAPRVVHLKTVQPTLPQLSLVPNNSAENVSTQPAAVTNRELELLRAEMREVKFSLNSFAVRQNVQSISNEADPYTLGEIFDSPFYEAYLALTVSGVSAEIARQLIAAAIPPFKSGALKADQLPSAALAGMFPSLVKFEDDPLRQTDPVILAIIGSTGVGKTTTVAKLAARVALRERRRVELITLDTYRIAAVEQLKTYAEIIGAGCHVVRSVLELDAALTRMPSDASVLIDTTGRNPHDLADQFELADYLDRRTDIRKCLAIQATTHPQDAIAAIRKFEMYGADCLALTKMDETTRPGALVEIAAESNLPLVYLCHGQRVPEDLQSATPESFVARILNSANSFARIS